MKAIIPLAGKGTRLRPHTHTTPKPLMKVGGRPVMSYILDDLIDLGVREVVFIVGYLGDVIRDFIAAEYPELEAHYVVQEVQDGTAAAAVKLTEPWADEDLLILFVDTIFDADLSLVRSLGPEYAGVIWAKEVEDYQRFGVIITRSDLTMELDCREAQDAGVQARQHRPLLYTRLRPPIRGPARHARRGSWTGRRVLPDRCLPIPWWTTVHGLLIAPVEGWYDCGKLDTLLETNRHLLGERARRCRAWGQRSGRGTGGASAQRGGHASPRWPNRPECNGGPREPDHRLRVFARRDRGRGEPRSSVPISTTRFWAARCRCGGSRAD